MSVRVSFDTSELRVFAADLGGVPNELARHAVPTLKRGAQNIKDDMRAEARKSEHFKGIAQSITYDVHQTSFDGRGVIEAEIGPTVGSGDPGNIGVVAYENAPSGYYGSAHGGATLEDPQKALDREMPQFEDAVNDFVDRALKDVGL